jgi:hypothetical protein
VCGGNRAFVAPGLYEYVLQPLEMMEHAFGQTPSPHRHGSGGGGRAAIRVIKYSGSTTTMSVMRSRSSDS